MTIKEQNKRLAALVKQYMKHQAKATAALREITAIGLLENEGNPITLAIRGEDMLRLYANDGGARLKPGDFQEVIEEAEKAIDNAGYIV